MSEFDDVYTKTDSLERIHLGEGFAEGSLSLGKDVDLDGRNVRFTMVSGIQMNGGTGLLKVGEPQGGINGTIDMYSIRLDASTATISAGGNSGRGQGRVTLYDRRGTKTVDIIGQHGNIELGGQGADGDLRIHDDQGNRSISLDGGSARITSGGNGRNGRIDLKNASDVTTIDLIGEHGNLILGGSGADGDIVLKSSDDEDAIVMDANNAALTVGGVGRNGDIHMRNSDNEDTIHIIGSQGDIRFLNADFAEEFTIHRDAVAVTPPGTVMVLGEDGNLVPSASAYDSAVVGVVAGAGQYKPALILDQQGGEDRKAIAMVGKAMVQVSARNGAVKVGDLLTTSDIPGVAMKVTERSRAMGAVIGKALAAHEHGTALVPVLVNLQ
ncbi:MAG: hypothetical protein AAGF78_00255 [Pseudomonadota bacterium]